MLYYKVARLLLLLIYFYFNIQFTFLHAQLIADVGEFLTEEPEYFAKGNLTIQAHIGFLSPLKVDEWSQETNSFGVKNSIPAIGLTVEKSIIRNLGVGATIAFQQWKVPVLDYQYKYYAGSLRATYHVAVMDRLDPYLGAAITYRRMNLSSDDRVLHNDKISTHLFLGARYYLGESIAAFAEIGGDALTYTKFGFSLYLP